MNNSLKSIISVLVILLVGLMSVNSSLALATYNFEYDNNGNLIQDKDHIYEYNGFNQLVKVYNSYDQVIEEYVYDDTGQRMMKVEYFNGETQTTYYPNPNLVTVVNSTGTYDFIYYYDDQGTLLGRKDPDGKKYYYHPDHLGSTAIVTNEAGEIVEETSYMPFGGVIEGGESKFLYTGKEKDSTELYYYGARYYNPETAKFTQPDTIIPDAYNPQTLNKYAYAMNNPYTYVDSSGHFASLAIPVAEWVYGLAVAVGTYTTMYVGKLIYDVFTEPTKDVVYDSGMQIGESYDSSLELNDLPASEGVVIDPVSNNAMEIETPGSNSKDSLELNLDKSVDIVGTKHKNVQPSQDVIDPETVDYYYEKISNGEVVDPISIKIVFDQGKYIADGHHRYVAYKKLGYDYADIPKVEEYVDSYNGFDDWSKVKYVSGAKGD